MRNLYTIGVLWLVVLVAACGDKKESADAYDVVTVGPTAIINDARTDSKQLSFRTTASVFDVDALPIGENYTSMEQLENAVLVAKMTNITHSAQAAKIIDEVSVFDTKMILGEDLKTTDVEVKMAYKDMKMDFFTSLRLGSKGFYEISQSGDTNRMYVVVLTVEKVQGESDITK